MGPPGSPRRSEQQTGKWYCDNDNDIDDDDDDDDDDNDLANLQL